MQITYSGGLKHALCWILDWLRALRTGAPSRHGFHEMRQVQPENLRVFQWNKTVMRSMHSPTAWSKEKAHWILEETHGRHVYRRRDGHFFWEGRSQITGWRDQQAAEGFSPWEESSHICEEQWETSLCEDNSCHKIARQSDFWWADVIYFDRALMPDEFC